MTDPVEQNREQEMCEVDRLKDQLAKRRAQREAGRDAPAPEPAELRPPPTAAAGPG
jgi:hypothetical protein